MRSVSVRLSSCRPEKLTRKAIVVAVGQVVVNEDWDRAVLFLEALFDDRDLGLGNLQAGPAVPLEGG